MSIEDSGSVFRQGKEDARYTVRRRSARSKDPLTQAAQEAGYRNWMVWYDADPTAAEHTIHEARNPESNEPQTEADETG